MEAMVAISRGLWLATLCVLVAACPMPNPAWVDSATSESNGSDSASGSMSEGTASAGETTTGTTSAVTVTEGSTEPTSTEPTTATATATSTVSTVTSDATTSDATTITDTSESDASTSTGEPSCEEILAAPESNALDLTLDKIPNSWDLGNMNECGVTPMIWTGGAVFTKLAGNRHAVEVLQGCGDMGDASLSGVFPEGIVHNLNAGDCIRLRAFLAWDPDKSSCTRLRGFEIEGKDSKALLFAAASGISILSQGNQVTPQLVEGCPETMTCVGKPGVHELASVLAGVVASEGMMQSTASWDFYNRRSHVHDFIAPNEDAVCESHLDWVINYVGQ